MTPKKKKIIGFISMLISGLTFAIATNLVRQINTTTDISPLTISVSRFLFAAPLLWLAFPRAPFKVKKGSKRWQFMLLGLIFSAASFSAGLALSRISSSLYVIILFINPVYTVLYTLIKGESIPRLTIIGLPLSILGLVLAVFPFGGGLRVDPWGVIITLINSVALSAYHIVSSRLFRNEDSRLPGSMWMFMGGLMVSLVIMPFAGFRLPANAYEWLLIGVYVTIGTIIPIITAVISISLLGVAQASMTNTFQPVATVVLSVLFFGEILNEMQIVGAFFVLLSVILLQVGKKKNTTLETASSSEAMEPGE